jgi:hypothetical protein
MRRRFFSDGWLKEAWKWIGFGGGATCGKVILILSIACAPGLSLFACTIFPR